MRLKLPIAHILKAQRRWEKTLRTVTATSRKLNTKPRKTRPKKSRLTEVSSFGSNPGNLRMLTYVPPQLPNGASLVVVLHGCMQTARDYDEGSGWSMLAKRHGFALVYAEQAQANNPNRCFNWFQSHDARRGSGEALSIRQMVMRIRRTHSIDPAQIFITGLSAGGAMASVMLAIYPEVFAGGGIIAGLPYGAAYGMRHVMSAMKRPQGRGAALSNGATSSAPRRPIPARGRRCRSGMAWRTGSLRPPMQPHCSASRPICMVSARRCLLKRRSQATANGLGRIDRVLRSLSCTLSTAWAMARRCAGRKLRPGREEPDHSCLMSASHLRCIWRSRGVLFAGRQSPTGPERQPSP
jgi:poly(hydroxyalkanoate) depolymerase family esterase